MTFLLSINSQFYTAFWSLMISLRSLSVPTKTIVKRFKKLISESTALDFPISCNDQVEKII